MDSSFLSREQRMKNALKWYRQKSWNQSPLAQYFNDAVFSEVLETKTVEQRKILLNMQIIISSK